MVIALVLLVAILAFFGLADIVGKYLAWAVVAFALILAASAAFMSFHISIPIDVASAIWKVVFFATIAVLVVRYYRHHGRFVR